MTKVNFNLKNKVKEEELIICLITYKGERIKISTKQIVTVKNWDTKEQRCIVNDTITEREKRKNKRINKLLDTIEDEFLSIIKSNNYRFANEEDSPEVLKRVFNYYLTRILGKNEEEEKAENITPLLFFEKFINQKRIVKSTGVYLSERTVAHHKTVLKRFKDFFSDENIKDNFTVFDKVFESKFQNWCYNRKKYSANTVPASLSILKVWLQGAREAGLINTNVFTNYMSKAKNVDNIYLNEDEIKRIYNLDVQGGKEKGIIDSKSLIEQTRDLFVANCYLGLRYSDLSRLNEKAIFDLDNNTVSLITEKTKEKVIIPLHPFVREIYKKYCGNFPILVAKDKSILHLQELGRLCEITDDVVIKEHRGGIITGVKYKKYQLIKNHTARRSFATNLYLKGAPVISIMKLTGHTTEVNFMKYIKISKGENANLMQQYFK